MHGMRLDELIGRLRRGGLDLTAEQVADAVWLARRLGAAASPDDPGGAEHIPEPEPVLPEERPGRPAEPAPPGGRRTGDDRAPSTPVPLHTELRGTSGDRAGASGAAPADGTQHAFPVRAPAATALPGLLGLEKALRALGRYRVEASASQEAGIDEEKTAEHAAASGLLLPVPRLGRRQRCDVQLLMDTGPAMAVWGRLVEELRQACQQSGAFASVRVHHLYDDGSGTPLVGTTAGPARHTRLRSADELHDPSGRCLTFVISDCVGPLWQNGAAQRLLHTWPRASPLAVIQPLPPRLWGRTALPAEPGLLLRPAELGGRITFLPDDEPWDEPAADARPVPVLQPSAEAFEAWARLLSGTGPTRERAWAAWTTPQVPSEAVARSAASPPGQGPRGDDELLRAFRAGASPGALRLAVYLAAAPLTLPVMQLVQRAMLPDTGPMELAEVLLGGLLRQLPGTEAQPCFAYPGRVQDLLLSSLDQDTAGLVLKHCSAYVERHFGKGTRNFAAFAAARLADHAPTVGGPSLDADGPRDAEGGVEAELFARIPARVLRFYLPDLVTPRPVEEAERLYGQWQAMADPEVLHRAREQAEAAVRAPVPAGDDGVRARLVLGRVLRAEAGTSAARGAGRRTELLRTAVEELAAAHSAATADSVEQADAALELAAGRHELWRLTGETDQLTAALDVLAPETAPWPTVARPAGAGSRAGETGAVPESEPAGAGRFRVVHRARLLRRGRILLDLARPGAATGELEEACALLDADGAPGAVRSPALLDLARALRAAGAEDARTREALVRAERAAGDDPELRLPCLTALAAFHDAAGETREADEAYETAALLAPPDSPRRCELLTAWGESLLRRASARDGARIVDRAENVLREALKALPAWSTQRGRLQGLVGSALAQRFRHLGFLPDLFESRHLLTQAVRAAADAGVRAEAWLQLGRVRLEGWYRAGAPVLVEALQAYENAEREAGAAHGTDPGSVTAARARHGRGTVLVLMGRPGAALTAYRSARERWQELVAALREVDWTDVESTRRAEQELAAAPDRPGGARTMPEQAWGRAAPPWWSWSLEWVDRAGFDWS
ncbi:SAV_2336 N-terminal domain-related protein [Streptomyces blattellae]|uniref:SAV_2336 N-terminal domain-related protein n=1 Tax=Streptomyces blattellae TaxID=2569855 RepID=UPI0012B8191A|nr:SAV_2336 N-terminal domain-related protein [Streptomyces blattellae]